MNRQLLSWTACLTLSLALFCPAILDAEEFRLEHVVASYVKIGEKYARSIGKTVEAARQVCVEEYGFRMPARITVNVDVDRKKRDRLFNDGVDRFLLTLRSEKDLLQPKKSGIFHLYGLCHEVGHLAMYLTIPGI